MDFQLRPALPADAEALARLAERTFRETFAEHNSAEDMDLFCANAYSAAKQDAELRDPRREIWVAETAGRLVAYFMLTEGPPDGDVTVGARPLELQRIYVDREFHGRGVAHALMEKILERARAREFTTLWLGVWEHNQRALAYYAKFGFTTVGEHTFVLGKDPQRDLILALALTPKK